MRQLLNSQGPLTEKYPTTIKELIEEFSKHSREYHDPQEDKIRGYKDGHGASDDLIGCGYGKVRINGPKDEKNGSDQSINAIRVGCNNRGGTHLTKDCDLNEKGNRKHQVCYSSGEKNDEDWRKPHKEWLPYEEYKKVQLDACTLCNRF